MDKFAYPQKGTSAPFRLGGQKAAYPTKKQHRETRKAHIYAIARLREQKDRDTIQKPFERYPANVPKPMRWNLPEPPDIPEEKAKVAGAPASDTGADYEETGKQGEIQTAGDAEPDMRALARDERDQTLEAVKEYLEQFQAHAAEHKHALYSSPGPPIPADEQDASLNHDTVRNSSDDRRAGINQAPTETAEEESLSAKGFLAYKQLWYRENVDISVNGKMLSGIPIFLRQGALRMVNEVYSYIIPLDCVDFIRTCDGYKSACDQISRGVF